MEKKPTIKKPAVKPAVKKPVAKAEAAKVEAPMELEKETITMKKKDNYLPKPEKAPNKIFKITTWVLAGISIASLVALLVNVLRLNILPTKYLTLVIIGLVVLAALNLFFALFKKKEIILKSISIVLSLLYSGVAIFGFLKINDTLNFFNNFGTETITNTYNVIVAKESRLTEDTDLTDHTIYTYRDLTIDSNLVVDAIQKNYKANTEFVDNILNLTADISNDTDKVAAINAGTYEAFLSDNEIYKDSFKIIKTFDIITEAEKSDELDITKDPFVIFLSGIDTRTGTLPSRSLSDVNIVATINPSEHKILLTAIPRDYYVHLAGTDPGALPDKLTHAGSHGGLALSKATVEELLGIKINYYIRVNFNFVKNLVDSIGGITVNSDVNYSFNCWTDRGCKINPGDNAVDGRCALAFARERKAYSAGDRHRGENQEQVISRILDKVSKSSTLLSSYSDILNALNGTFETNFTSDDITTFFKNQLEDMHGWTVENQNLNGTGGMAFTYSYPSQALSVMYPDPATIDAAKAKINEYLGIEPEEPEAPAEETPAE